MATIRELQKTAKRLTSRKIQSDLFRFIRKIEKELAAYNVATLHEDSQDVFGKPLGFYSVATEIITDGRKKAGEPFNLLESGDFLDGLFAKVSRDSIFFDTKDSKKREVLDNLLSDNIFGLQDQDLQKVIDARILPFFLKYFRKELL
ncbi:MAG: hypothetical protein AAF599_03410 [Bacteroidota bacterium]